MSGFQARWRNGPAYGNRRGCINRNAELYVVANLEAKKMKTPTVKMERVEANVRRTRRRHERATPEPRGPAEEMASELPLGPDAAGSFRGPQDTAAWMHEFGVDQVSLHRRHGDPFPLPRLREEYRGGLCESSLHRLVDRACKTLTDLAVGTFVSTTVSEDIPMTRVQSWMLSDLRRRISQHGPRPHMTESEALAEISSGSHLYKQEGLPSHLAEFDITKIKILQRHIRPSLAADLSSALVRGYLDHFREMIEKPARELESQSFKDALPVPYWDPKLRKSRRQRIALYQGLWRRDLLTFRRREKGRIGVFTVNEKDGWQRLIIDARVANASHQRPPTTRLSTPASLISLDYSPETMEANGFGGVAGDSDSALFPTAESGDVGDCFYNFLVPELASWFSTGDWFSTHQLEELGLLPCTVYDDLLGHETPVQEGEMLVPCFAGMAMGWSWSLFLANEAIVHQCSIPRGQLQDDMIRDRAPAPAILPDRPAVGVYVDNIHVFGGRAGQAGERMSDIAKQFSQLGIPYTVDEVESALEMDSLGLRLDFKGRVAAFPKPSRSWRLWLATKALLKRHKIHGKTLQIWLGHLVHHFSLMKAGMAILSACYTVLWQTTLTIVLSLGEVLGENFGKSVIWSSWSSSRWALRPPQRCTLVIQRTRGMHSWWPKRDMQRLEERWHTERNGDSLRAVIRCLRHFERFQMHNSTFSNTNWMRRVTSKTFTMLGTLGEMGGLQAPPMDRLSENLGRLRKLTTH